jgi:acyl carrier protein
MTVSSRTPEGLPHRCPICGKEAALEPSFPGGDSTCPSCGHLLWWFRDRFGEGVSWHTSFLDDVGADSLDMVELVMELEEEFDVTIPDHEAEQVRTVADAIALIERHRSGAA